MQMRTRFQKDELLTTEAMGCFRLHPPPPKISGPIAPRKVKFYMHVAFDPYFQNMSRKVQFYRLNGLNLALIFWLEFCLEKCLNFKRQHCFLTILFQFINCKSRFFFKRGFDTNPSPPPLLRILGKFCK